MLLKIIVAIKTKKNDLLFNKNYFIVIKIRQIYKKCIHTL